MLLHENHSKDDSAIQGRQFRHQGSPRQHEHLVQTVHTSIISVHTNRYPVTSDGPMNTWVVLVPVIVNAGSIGPPTTMPYHSLHTTLATPRSGPGRRRKRKPLPSIPEMFHGYVVH